MPHRTVPRQLRLVALLILYTAKRLISASLVSSRADGVRDVGGGILICDLCGIVSLYMDPTADSEGIF